MVARSGSDFAGAMREAVAALVCLTGGGGAGPLTGLTFSESVEVTDMESSSLLTRLFIKCSRLLEALMACLDSSSTLRRWSSCIFEQQ